MQKPITLIIDDEPVAREALEALLATEHYQVESATDGLQGLERAAQLLPDVILLDVMMPGIDGYEVCRRLRADPRLATVPVLMVTALDNQDARLRGLESGADDFISKPFDRAELRARLRTITRLNRYRNLSTERARFAWIVEQTQDGYLILGEDDKILYANRQARLYLGLSDLALSGITNKKALNFLDVARQQYQLQPGDAWSKWPAVRDPLRLYLVRPETSTAHSFWLMVNLLPSEVENNGRLLRLSNVTDRIFSQQDVRKFHHAIEQKFRTPISQIQISLDLLLRRTKKQHFDDLSDLATHAIEGCQKLKARWTISFAI